MTLPSLDPSHAFYAAIGDVDSPIEVVLDYDSGPGMRGFARTYARPDVRNLGEAPWIPLTDRQQALRVAANLAGLNPDDAIESLEHRVRLQLVVGRHP